MICSTALDLDTQDPLLRFSSLAETEFIILEWSCSHHRLYIRLKDFFQAPQKYARGYKDAEYFDRTINDLRGFSQRWFKWNSQGLLGFFWSGIQLFTNPIFNFINQNQTFMNILEKICKAFWGDNGISHAIFIVHQGYAPWTAPRP